MILMSIHYIRLNSNIHYILLFKLAKFEGKRWILKWKITQLVNWWPINLTLITLMMQDVFIIMQ